MRIFSFSRVIYDGYLTLDLFVFVIRQKMTRIFDFFVLFPDIINFLLKRIDSTKMFEKFYYILLSSITVSELNLFKVNNIHKIDLEGFGIVKDNPKDVIVTGEPSFLVDLFINRNKYNVICTEYDLHSRKVVGKLCLHRHKIEKMKRAGINYINQLFIFSFKEKELMKMADYILVYRDEEVIEYDSYRATLKDRLFYNITNKKLITYCFLAFFWLLVMIIISSILSFFVDAVASYLIGYILWFIATYISTVMYVNNEHFTIDHALNYILGIIPNFLLQLLFVLIFCSIIGLHSWFVILIGGLLAFPLLIFMTRFYRFD
ncbi:hypothetical protein OKW23_000817 [Bacilli bacterium PM5-9]|nr:hypothetical protein [Bacilli bacterium PM5-9]